MAIKKVWIDEDACTGCGLCEDTCPEVFEINDVAVVKEDADFGDRKQSRNVHLRLSTVRRSK